MTINILIGVIITISGVIHCNPLLIDNVNLLLSQSEPMFMEPLMKQHKAASHNNNNFYSNKHKYSHRFTNQKNEIQRMTKNDYIEELEEKALKLYFDKFIISDDNNNKEIIDDKIVGGVDAEPGEAPFLAQLYRKNWWQTSFLCGGSLISKRTVLSAGHCVS